MPDEAIVGIPTKVVNFPPDQKNRNKVGLAIAYDTGITLQIEPNRQPNTSLFHDVPGAVAMGRESYESEAAAPRAGKVNGRDAYLRPAGTQTLRSRKHQVPNMVGWMIGNTSYRLESSASSGVPLEDLVAAADSIR